MNICQFTQQRPCPEPAAFRITIRSKHGLTTQEQHCRPHVSVRADAVSKDGGQIIGARGLPEPTPIRPAPVGLDAIAPARGEG